MEAAAVEVAGGEQAGAVRQDGGVGLAAGVAVEEAGEEAAGGEADHRRRSARWWC